MLRDSFLHELETPNCQSGILSQKVCSLLGPRSRVFERTAKIWLAFRSLHFIDCMQATKDATKLDLEEIKRDYGALEVKVNDVRA